MGMGIDKARENYFAGAVDLGDLLAVLSDPGIAQGVFCCADRDDLAAETEDGGVGEDREIFEGGAAAGAEAFRRKAYEFPDVADK